MSPARIQSPGLLADPADFNRLRDAIGRPGLLQDLAAFVRRLAEHDLTEPVATHTLEGRRLLPISRLVLRRVINCGLVYQLDRDERFARRALEDLRAAAAFPDWNPSHFLDTAELCCAFALGLDWLHEVISEDERTVLEDAVIHLGLEASDPHGSPWMTTSTNNWNAVCNGGLAMAAIMVRHRCPELADTLIARCIRNLPLHGFNYGPAGAFIEGSTYWAYGSVYHAITVESLQRATGSTHGLDALPGFRESADFIVQIVGPSGDFYSYFDSRPLRIPLPALTWFGRHFDNPVATRSEADFIRRIITGPLEPVLWTENRCFALSLLWLQPEHFADTSPMPLAWSGVGPNPVAFWRDAWTSDAVWVGTKGGKARLSHGHIDAGSFVFEAGGVRWAIDSGMEEYHRLESMGVNLWGEDRWTLFRLGPEGHSIPRIDGVFPDPEGSCPRIDWTDTPAPRVAFDLSALYPGVVARLHRTIAAEPGRATRWTDEIGGLDKGRVYRFTWVTEADVAVGTDGVMLSQNGRRLRLSVESADPVSVRVLDHTALLRPNDTPMPDVKRVEFAVVSPGSDFSVQVVARLA